MIDAWREAVEREAFLAKEVGANFRDHNNIFFQIINNLVRLKYGTEISKLIEFYVFGMVNPDGSRNQLKDEDGRPIKLNSHEDLWNLIQKINSNIENDKK